MALCWSGREKDSPLPRPRKHKTKVRKRGGETDDDLRSYPGYGNVMSTNCGKLALPQEFTE
jgi:hypothetical protein